MVFNRIVPPQTTIVEEEDGKFIFPPKKAFAVLLESAGSQLLEARVAFAGGKLIIAAEMGLKKS